MNRRRLGWLCAALLVIGSIITAIYVVSTRDSDFIVIGRKTHGVRANLAMLEKTVNTADFRDCRTVQDAVDRLHINLEEGPVAEDEVFGWFRRRALRVNIEAFREAGVPEIRERPFRLPVDSETMTLKQLLREVFRAQNGEDVRFILQGRHIEATTMKHAQEERQRYLDSVSVYDRMRHWWQDINGEVEPDLEMLITF